MCCLQDYTVKAMFYFLLQFYEEMLWISNASSALLSGWSEHNGLGIYWVESFHHFSFLAELCKVGQLWCLWCWFLFPWLIIGSPQWDTNKINFSFITWCGWSIPTDFTCNVFWFLLKRNFSIYKPLVYLEPYLHKLFGGYQWFCCSFTQPSSEIRYVPTPPILQYLDCSDRIVFSLMPF